MYIIVCVLKNEMETLVRNIFQNYDNPLKYCNLLKKKCPLLFVKFTATYISRKGSHGEYYNINKVSSRIVKFQLYFVLLFQQHQLGI